VIVPDHAAFDRNAISPRNSTKEYSMRRVLAASAVLIAFASSAEARTHHHYYRHYSGRHYRQHARGLWDSGFAFGNGFSSFADSGEQPAYEQHSSYGRARSGGRPAAWCGWYMRGQVGADPGPQYNLARSWAHYGSNASGPSVGTIVVWRHHVGKIVGQENGQWIVESGNDGHAVRARPLSLAGAIAFRNAYASF